MKPIETSGYGNSSIRELDSRDFYRSIEPFDDFEEAFNPERYSAVPYDWYIAVTDIKGSTAAIRENKYKEVNIVGASAIISVLNSVKGTEVPFVFGGDGASFLLPPSALVKAASAMQGTREMARDAFGLTLRSGIVPVSQIQQSGREIYVAKYRLSEKIAIAMFKGGGLSLAEELVKDPEKEKLYDIKNYLEPSPTPADFKGLECRWNPVRAKMGEMLTLMVRASGQDGEAVYLELFNKVREVYGEKENYCPTREPAIKLTFKKSLLRGEFGVQTHGGSILKRILYAMKLAVENLGGSMLLQYDIRAAGVPGKKYVRDLVTNTDFQKFDETLRMVMDSSPGQSRKLLEYLDTEYRRGRLSYGSHTGKEALITCLVFDREDKHLHFIDGASGGYALAATKMKEQEKLKS